MSSVKQATELAALIKNIGKTDVGIVSLVKVKSVDKQNNTCVVENDGLQIENVRLRALKEFGKGLKIYPAVGSDVLVECIDNGQYTVQMFSEVEAVVLDIDNKKIEVDKGGVFVGTDTNDLLKTLTKIIDAMLETVVLQGRNPNKVKLTEAKNELKNFLK